ncbi:hypothetical protein [Acidihalobacter prosperus]|uniref:hypothetical protein n=1 Tax=Acidihalobacter prosperus TaxID=160660 RepID=UPI000507B1D1|nr:hypothetical protein [Acidihalobacter prosperus]
MLKEHQIKHENGRYWIYDGKEYFNVMRCGATCSESIATFEHDDDGFSCAKAYVDYLANRDASRSRRQATVF